MFYTVVEVSEITKLSKMSIYNRLKLDELKQCITKKQGVTFISEDGLKLIQNNLKVNIDDLNLDTNDVNTFKEESPNKALQQDSSIKEDYIKTLKDQLKEKDIQLQESNERLHESNERLKQEQDLNKNNQILQLRQPQDIKALESHFQDLDAKLEDVKTNMQHRKEDQPKGFLSKLFNKK